MHSPRRSVRDLTEYFCRSQTQCPRRRHRPYRPRTLSHRCSRRSSERASHPGAHPAGSRAIRTYRRQCHSWQRIPLVDSCSQSGSTVGTHACDASYGTTPRPRPVLCSRLRRSTTWMCQAAERNDAKQLYRPGLTLEAGSRLPADHSGAASCFLRLAFCSALSVRSCTRLASSVCM